MNNNTNSTPAPIALSVILDRSGSMMTIADDIVDGFNALLANQRTQSGEVLVTLAQFDTENPFELLIDAVPLREVTDMEREWYQPRGSTPLYDAIGRLLSHIDASPLVSGDAMDHVVVVITDGQENASREFDRKQVSDLIKERSDSGWVFIYLGSEFESYDDAHNISVSSANARNWDKSSYGTRDMMDKVSSSLTSHRGKTRDQRRRDKDDFYGDGGER
ncbi:MAG: VWA domain-containing protein [Actinomycetia bacterium]|nr:VWA domain-containing protein [Actinomycetes bacterium]